MEHFNWPIAVLLICVFFMFLFKRDISSFLGRTQKISKDGIQTSPVQIQQPTEKESLIEELLKEFGSVVLREQEENIKRDLENRRLANVQDKINLLIRHLAVNQLALHFERINALIWGSQIAMLQHLNSRANGDSVEVLKTFYDNASRLYPDTFVNYSFEQYLQFLISFNLIVKQGDRYLLTNLGREFLVFLAATGQTRWRPF